MRRFIYLFFGSILLVIAGLFIASLITPKYKFDESKVPGSFKEYYEKKAKEEEQIGVRKGNGQRLVKYAPKTKVVFLYIHGFTASRAEGEYVVDILSDSLKANTYYMRLPGHGTNPEDHASVTFRDYLDDGEIALRMVQELGDKVVVIGTSMGGLLATYLAADNPDLVDALILCSPFYDYANKAGRLISIPGVIGLMELLDGPYRTPSGAPNWKSRKQPGYENFWYTKYKYRSLKSLDNLRRFASRDEVFQKVKCPLLMLYYYKDMEHMDRAASVAAMHEALNQFNVPLKIKCPISDGDHVLLSAYVKTDKETILKKIFYFLGKAL